MCRRVVDRPAGMARQRHGVAGHMPSRACLSAQLGSHASRLGSNNGQGLPNPGMTSNQPTHLKEQAVRLKLHVYSADHDGNQGVHKRCSGHSTGRR